MIWFVIGVAIGALIVWEFSIEYPRWLWTIRSMGEELLKTFFKKMRK